MRQLRHELVAECLDGWRWQLCELRMANTWLGMQAQVLLVLVNRRSLAALTFHERHPIVARLTYCDAAARGNVHTLGHVDPNRGLKCLRVTLAVEGLDYALALAVRSALVR